MEYENTIKKLITLSDLIINELDILSELSFNEYEDSSEFEEHVNNVTNYLNIEKEILDGFNYEDLEIIYRILPNYDNNTEAFGRLSCNIGDQMTEYSEEDCEEETEEIDLDSELANIIEEYNQSDHSSSSIDKYIIEEANTKKYSIRFIDRIAEIAIKKMPNRIRETYTDNEQDDIFKSRLLKEFNYFKYFFFQLDYNLERMGAEYRFNLEKLPLIENVDNDISAISHNQCVALLDKIYSVKTDETDLEMISEALFNMICLEEHLKHITDKSVEVLLLLCNELEQALGKRFYGEIAHKKLILRKDNN